VLTIVRLREMLSYDEATGVFVWLKAPGRNFRYRGKQAGSWDTNGYLGIGLDGEMYLAHRLAWFYVYVNRCKHDNRICNLRQATVVQNGHNVGLQSRNTSGVRGVSWRPSREVWRARITVDAEDVSLGNYQDFFEAVCARKSAERRHYGEFAPQ
jgi:hypothetical protein